MALEDVLRARGFTDEEIEQVLAESESGEPKLKSLTDFKRAHQEERAAREKAEQQLAAYARRERFTELLPQIPEPDRQLLSFEDVKDAAQDITPTFLRVRAQEKREEQETALANQARTLGLLRADGQPDTQAMRLVLQQAQQATADQAAQAGYNRDQQYTQASHLLSTNPNVPMPIVGVDATMERAMDEGDFETIRRTIARNPEKFVRTIGGTDE